MHKHTKERISKICDMMGEDFDDLACQELMDHMEQCPTCKVYFDTVKKTIVLCRENDCPEKLPDDVNNRLLKVLDLQQMDLPEQNDKKLSL